MVVTQLVVASHSSVGGQDFGHRSMQSYNGWIGHRNLKLVYPMYHCRCVFMIYKS